MSATPSGDKYDNGSDEVDGEFGENRDKSKEQNDEGGDLLKEDQTDNTPVTASTPVGTEEPTAEINNSTEVGGDRKLQDTNAEASTSTNQIVEIALFLVPKDCKSDRSGYCDWVTLGIGSEDDEMEGGMSYCCSKDTAERGICDSADIGTMIIDHKKFEGDHRKIQVASKPLEEFEMDE